MFVNYNFLLFPFFFQFTRMNRYAVRSHKTPFDRDLPFYMKLFPNRIPSLYSDRNISLESRERIILDGRKAEIEGNKMSLNKSDIYKWVTFIG